MTPSEAAHIQRQLRSRLTLADGPGEVGLVARADTALDTREKLGFGGVVVYALPGLGEVARQTAACPLTFPYVPGLRAFREAPVLLGAFAKLRCEPEMLVFDAHRVAHPRRMGLASHLGLVLDRPSSDCATSAIIGTYGDPPPEKGGPPTCRQSPLP